MDENCEALSELFEEHGIQATSEQIKQIAEDYEYHLDMMREMHSNQHIESSKSVKENHQREIKQLKEQIEQTERKWYNYMKDKHPHHSMRVDEREGKIWGITYHER